MSPHCSTPVETDWAKSTRALCSRVCNSLMASAPVIMVAVAAVPSAAEVTTSDKPLSVAAVAQATPPSARNRRGLATALVLAAMLALGLGVGLGVGLAAKSGGGPVAAPVAILTYSPPPGTGATVQQQVVAASLTLVGLSISDVTPAVKAAFVTTVATQLSVPSSAVTVTGVAASSRRHLLVAGVIISFTVVPPAQFTAQTFATSVAQALASDPTGSGGLVAALNSAFAALPTPPPRVLGTSLAQVRAHGR